MKIAVWHNLPSGGAKRALYNQIRGLVERGHLIEAWCPSTADRSYMPLNDLVREHVVGEGARGDWQRAGPLDRLSGSRHQLKQMESICQRCAREIERRDFDVVFANGCLVYHAPRITRHVRLPNVLYLQEPDRSLYEARPVLPWVARPQCRGTSWWKRVALDLLDLRRLLAIRSRAREEWLNVHAAGALLVNSYYSREVVSRVFARDSTVCYLGIDTGQFRDLTLPRERFVVGLGSFHAIKGIDVAIQAVARLASPRPPLVWIGNAGNQSYLQHLTQLARSLQVDFQPRHMLPDHEVVDVLNRASLLIYTSRLEPFGLAVLEAGACATPVVAAAEGGVRETVRDGINGLLVDPAVPALSDAMQGLLEHPRWAREIGDCARAYVEDRWSLPPSIDRLESCLRNALRDGTPSQRTLLPTMGG